MDCPRIPNIAYRHFSKRLRTKISGKHIPISGSIELTARCNVRCAHCYINQSAGDLQIRSAELDLREWQRIIDELVDEGCLWLLISGGEPLLYPHFLEIYTYAKKKGLLITLFTNATLITPEIADFLKEWPPFSIEVTLYGATAETYERVTGVPGSYKRCIKGIDLILERGLPLKLKTMLLTLNQHELAAMQDYAAQLGATFRYDTAVNARLDGGQQPAAYRIPLDEVLTLEMSDEEVVAAWKARAKEEMGPLPQPEYLYYCGAGIESFHIDPYGQLSLCMMARSPAYDLAEGTFHDGWYNFIPQVRWQEREKSSPCQTCEIATLCGQCPGWSIVEGIDQEMPVPHLCQLTHARIKVIEQG